VEAPHKGGPNRARHALKNRLVRSTSPGPGIAGGLNRHRMTRDQGALARGAISARRGSYSSHQRNGVATMKCLLVVAHPLPDSLCAHLAQRAATVLAAAGHEVVREDLYAEAFEPALTAGERQTYYAADYDHRAVAGQVARLLEAEALVLVFPTWWFGFPAILKGWFDRVWGPGIAYDHADDLGAIKPRLHKLRRVLAVTTLGSPWWVDRLVMRRPVRRVLKTAILGTCAPACRFDMLTLYQAEKLAPAAVAGFCERLERVLGRWR